MRCRRITLPCLFALAASVLWAVPAQADDAGLPGFGAGPAAALSAHAASFRDVMLDAHNAERARRHVPPLAWSERLARDAHAHARYLARRGYLQHARMAGPGEPQGENLWMGSRGAFSYGQMMDSFLDERADYVAGAVPHISRTGNWSDTGHYSQIIWRTTTTVGCAVASSRDFDFLVCRYDPAGNLWGKRADEGDRRIPVLAMTGF